MDSKILLSKLFKLRHTQCYRCLKTRMHCYRKPDKADGLEGMRFLTQGERLGAQYNQEDETKITHEHIHNTVRGITQSRWGFFCSTPRQWSTWADLTWALPTLNGNFLPCTATRLVCQRTTHHILAVSASLRARLRGFWWWRIGRCLDTLLLGLAHT